MKNLVGFLGWLGVALVGVALYLKYTQPELEILYKSLAAAGFLVTAIYAFTQRRDLGRSFQGRGAQYGSIAAGSVLVFLGILVAINWISNRQNKRWDLTESKEFSLSDQTKQIVTSLKAPLKIKVFWTSTTDRPDSAQAHRDRLEGYTYLSNQVSIDYIDANGSPTESEKYAITAVPTLILEYAGRTQRATSDDEQSVTNALKKVIEGKAKKAYFTQGHGEKDPDDAQTGQGYKGASAALTDENFDVAKLQIAQRGSIPVDATVVVVAGATGDFLPQETELIRTFLKNGGKVLLMIDPPVKGGTAQPSSLIALAKEWGIQLGDDIVVDPTGQLVGFDASVPVGMPVQHPITAKTTKMTAFRLSRSVAPIEGGSDGKIAQTFIQSGEKSWAEKDVKGLYDTGTPKRDVDKGDKAGPISLGAAVSAPAAGVAPSAEPDAPKPESRLVVIGDSDFASNAMVQVGGNSDLFLNAANWLAQQENLIAIRPKSPEDRRLQLTQAQQTNVFWLTLVIIPLLLFGNAFRVYWKRR